MFPIYFRFWPKMDDDKVCAVCYDTFKFPKVLPCKHTFCLWCLEDFLVGCKDKSNVACPLCRELCYVSEKGFADFPTNYFVPVSKYQTRCFTCRNENVSKVCYQCDNVFCRICHSIHFHESMHAKETGSGEDSDDGNVLELPIHLRLPLMHSNIRTELICERSAVFVGDFSASSDAQKNINFMFSCRDGGAYVHLNGEQTLFKYNKLGKIVKRLDLSGLRGTKTSGFENSAGAIIMSHLEAKCIYVYKQKQNTMHVFAKTADFFPLAVTELLDGNVAACGPGHVCYTSCDKNNCKTLQASHGVLSIYSANGELISKIEKDAGEYIFKRPYALAKNTSTKTIAVCDLSLNKVIIIDYIGRILGFYKGLQMILPMPSMAPSPCEFLPMAICSTSNGNFVVSDPRNGFLQIMNSNGKPVGILRLDNNEDIRDITSLCVDYENNIWIGHHVEGTIGILKPDCYKNDLSGQVLPFLGHDHNDFLQFLSRHHIEVEDD